MEVLRINSLYGRIILAIAGLALLAGVALVMAGYRESRELLLEREEGDARLLAQVLSAAVESELGAQPPAADDTHLDSLIERVGREVRVRNLFVLSPSGEVLARSAPEAATPIDVAAIERILASRETLVVLDEDRRLLSVRVAVHSPSRQTRGAPPVEFAVVTFEREISPVLATLHRNAWRRGVAAFALATGLAAVLYALLRHIVIRPAARLALQANRLGDGDLTARNGLTAATAGSAEIHRLAAAFDSMAGRLQRAEAEQEERASERTRELEHAVRELESFSYAVSHDLRSPLRSIDGFSRILGDSLGPRLDPRSAELLQRIRRQAQHMGRLIDDLLTLAQVSRAEPERGVVDLSLLAGDCIGVLRRGEPQRAVEVVIQPGMSASADPQLLRIALSQLLDNAWKFTRGIPNARIEVGVMQRLQQTVAFVRDNGAGFDMAYVERLFTEFRRLHSARELAGTGIGLAIVQRIVQRHGGRIWAEGRPGEGATFFFTLAGA